MSADMILGNNCGPIFFESNENIVELGELLRVRVELLELVAASDDYWEYDEREFER